jgi:CBS domain containing-hemolysin-like protein
MIVGALLLVALNAFFVASEFALVAVRRTRIDQLVAAGSTRARAAQRAMRELNLLLSGCQLGITFASLGLGWIGEPAFAELLRSTFEPLPSPFDIIATHGVASVIAFAIITFLHVVLGELVPKNLAIAIPEGVALWIATPMRVFTALFRPLIWVFNEGANLIVRLFGIKPQKELRSVLSLEEMRLLVEESRRSGTIAGGDFLPRSFSFPDKHVFDVLVPHSDVKVVAPEADVSIVLDMARRFGISRFPVSADWPNECLGVVHLSDLLEADHRRRGAPASGAMRDALVVPESLPLEDLLGQMNQSRTHLAIIVDEHGAIIGIVTLADVLAELVGEMPDEHRGATIHQTGAGYRVAATIRPDALFQATGFRLPEGDHKTLGGFITQRLGRLAKPGDEVDLEGWRIRVNSTRRRRVGDVQLIPMAVDADGPLDSGGSPDIGPESER